MSHPVQLHVACLARLAAREPDSITDICSETPWLADRVVAELGIEHAASDDEEPIRLEHVVENCIDEAGDVLTKAELVGFIFCAYGDLMRPSQIDEDLVIEEIREQVAEQMFFVG